MSSEGTPFSSTRRFFARFANLFRAPRAERELTREIQSHLALLQEDFERAGMPPEEAQRAARRAYGGVEQAKELHRETRSFVWVEQFFRDLRYALRQLRRSPGFTLTALAALALGIGATTAIFSIVNTVLLKPVQFPDADRLVVLTMSPGSESGDGEAMSPAKFEHFRAQSSVLQSVSAALTGPMNYTGGDAVEQWWSMRASADTFRCLGISVFRGRTFTAEEDLPNGPRVALISEDLWARRFKNDPQILGRTISLNGEPHTVIGIADTPLREFDAPPVVFVPFQIDPNTSDQGDYFNVFARLRPGVTLEQAKAQLQASAAQYRTTFPDAIGPKDGFTAMPYREDMIGDTRPLLLVLLGAVSLVLLIACANVANLLLARGAGRRREIAIRAAIGAGRARVTRQLMTESVLLSLAGGILGLSIGYGGIRALLAVNTAGLPLVGKDGAAVNLDWRVMTFALAVSLLTGILFGLFPALQASRVDLSSALKDSSRTGTSLGQNKTRAALVIGEVSLAVILLVGSALLIRSFVALYAVDLGFDTSNVITMNVLLAGPKYSKTAATADKVRAGLEHLRSLPGVVAAGATCCLPLAQGTYDLNFEIAGQPSLALWANQDVGWAAISPGYLEVFRVPVRRGRAFTDRDDNTSPAVVVINERMAQKYWKDTDPLGGRIVIGRGAGMREFSGEPVRQIIGIVGDMRDEALEANPRPVMYVPLAQLTDAANALFFRLLPMAWVVRTGTLGEKGAPRAGVAAIRDALQQATGLPVTDVSTMDHDVWAQTGRRRFNLLLMSLFGFAALLLAAIGIYGLMAYTVEQRTHEIGVRLALGAEAAQLKNMVVREGMTLALAGVVAGLGAAWVVSRVMESLLFGVKARDPMMFLAVAAVLTAVAFLAVWLPARRALRIDPMVALRHE